MQHQNITKLDVEELRDIAEKIRTERGFALVPTWIFDLEKSAGKLTEALMERTQANGSSSLVRAQTPELAHLRRAILKIGGICATGAFAMSREAIYGVIVSAIEDVEEYVRSNR